MQTYGELICKLVDKSMSSLAQLPYSLHSKNQENSIRTAPHIHAINAIVEFSYASVELKQIMQQLSCMVQVTTKPIAIASVTSILEVKS